MSIEESKQPRKNYTHSSSIDDEILANLGVIKGFEHFNHRFQRAENIMSMISWLHGCRDNGLLINRHSKKPIKIFFKEDTLDKLNFIWKRSGFLLTQWVNTKLPNSSSTIRHVLWTRFLHENPATLEKNQEVHRLPSLRNMKPRDLITSDTYLIRIAESIPVSLAFEGEDPIQLSKSGKMQYDYKGKIWDMFTDPDDINNSIDFTKHVSRNFFDQTTNILFDLFNPLANDIMATAFKMFKEIREHNGGDSKVRTSYTEGLD